MTMLIVYLMIALVFSFFCSIAEAVLLSVRSAYIAALLNQGVKGAKTLAELKENLDRPLAAILSLNTVAHTAGAAGVGAQSAIIFGNNYIGATSAVLTFLILILSEIIPKTLGATYWRKLALPVAPIIMGLTKLMLPLVWMSERITRLLSSPDSEPSAFSRDELEAMAEIGAEEGKIDAKELKIVSNLMRLRGLSVRDVMTPRSVVFMVPANMTVADFFDEHAAKPFSRIPIHGEDQDDVTGYVLKMDLLVAQARDEFDRKLSEFIRPWLALPDFLSVSEIFDRLMHERAHIALVVDEYGTTQGLVTLEDVVETLFGLEITDELDTVRDMQALAHRRWRERVTALGIDPDSLEEVH